MHSPTSSQDSSMPQSEHHVNKNNKKKRKNMNVVCSINNNGVRTCYHIPDALSSTSSSSGETDTSVSSHNHDSNLEMTMNQPNVSYSCPSEGAQHLVNYFARLHEKHPDFLGAFQRDRPDGRVKNFFWTDKNSVIDYKCFGDVLILDTTTLKLQDKYQNQMICACFFGLNHHRQYILFGCGLLLDETIHSFVWLLETFVKAMRTDHCQPKTKTIVTDESLTMADAIEQVLSEAKHHIGLWYIHRNAARFLSTYHTSLFHNLFEQWAFESRTEKEFNSRWVSLLDQFNLHDNPWLNKLYITKKKWAPLFNKKTFVAGGIQLDTTASVECMFEAKTLPMFVTKYLKVVAQRRMEESYEDHLCEEIDRETFLHNNSVEQQAACIYTCTTFKMFQKELIECLLWEIDEITSSDVVEEVMTAKFRLTEEDGNESIVEFNSLDFSAVCCCSKYESVGILCRHVLRVFRERNVFQIPPRYVLKRWTKTAKNGM